MWLAHESSLNVDRIKWWLRSHKTRLIQREKDGQQCEILPKGQAVEDYGKEPLELAGERLLSLRESSSIGGVGVNRT